MSGIFSYCSSLKELPDISKWFIYNNENNKNPSFKGKIRFNEFPRVLDNTGVSFAYMFYECNSLEKLPDISNWNTEKVLKMDGMFYSCNSLIELPDISKWNLSNVLSLDAMFSCCSSLISLPDISKWDISNNEDLSRIFYNCTSLISLPDISKWNVSNNRNLSGMFFNCTSLINLPDISKWDTTKVKNFNDMFFNCKSLSYLPDISTWKFVNENAIDPPEFKISDVSQSFELNLNDNNYLNISQDNLFRTENLKNIKIDSESSAYINNNSVSEKEKEEYNNSYKYLDNFDFINNNDSLEYYYEDFYGNL